MSSYQILLCLDVNLDNRVNRGKFFLIVFPNRRQYKHHALLRCAAIYYDLWRLSGRIAHDLIRLIREQIRVDTIRCEQIRVVALINTHEAELLRAPAFRCIPTTMYDLR